MSEHVQNPGKLALEYCKKRLELKVLKSNNGYYLGTFNDEGPCSRESLEYWKTQDLAEKAMASGDWTQKDTP
jgi:hypothetical protein